MSAFAWLAFVLLPAASLAWALASPHAAEASVPATPPPEPVEFWVVEPNEGDSSGGHAALRLGEWLYHVEHRGDGLIADRRTPRRLFEAAYRGRGNRAIRAIPLALAPSEARALEARLEARGFDRDRRLDQLDALDQQTAFLARISEIGAISVDVPALGLFEAGAGRPSRPSRCPGESGSSDEAAAPSLERRLASRYGPGWLDARRRRAHAQLAQRIRALVAFEAPGSRDAVEANRRADPYRRLIEAAQTAAAFDLVAECRPALGDRLRPAAPLAAPGSTSHGRDDPRAAWRRSRRALAERWVELAGSDRPDPGLALMLAHARLAALDRSIASGRLHLIDSYVESKDETDLLEGLPASFLPRLRDEIETEARIARERLASGRAPLEARLADLERSEHALRHSRAGTRHRAPTPLGPMSSSSRQYAPATRVLPWPTGLTLRDVEAARRRSEIAARSLRRALETDLDYALLTRNCVTELLAELPAFESARSDVARPSLRADRSAPAGTVLRGRFIPAVAGRAVARAMGNGPPRILPSAREIVRAGEGERDDSDEPSTSASLRETFTLTSRTYRPHAADSHFLVFPQPFWLRPLLGLANLGYGLGNASLGLLAAPFDRSERLRRGAMGIVMSVPELFFLRVRQGTYPATPATLLGEWDRRHNDAEPTAQRGGPGGPASGSAERRSLAGVSGDQSSAADAAAAPSFDPRLGSNSTR